MKADDGMLRALAEATGPVDDSMAYLLVSHTWDAESGSDLERGTWGRELLIENLTGVMPLDDNARRQFEISLDKRVNLSACSWRNLFQRLCALQEADKMRAGARNVYKILGLDTEALA